MKQIVISKKEDGKKLNTVILKQFPGLTLNNLNKALRKKDIRINNVRINQNTIVYENDVISIYISDENLIKNSCVDISQYIYYEDDNICIVNKTEGMCVKQDVDNELSLEQMLIKYANGQFVPMPCHRLDRNTKGLVVFAKNAEALDEMKNCFEKHLIKKYYKCLVYGIMENKTDILTDYLFKDAKKNIVKISDKKQKGYVEIKTKYTVQKEYDNNTSVLEVELLTGKTHQIRAHLASIGHYIIGDNKYGNKEINKSFKKSTQQLVAYKLVFNTKTMNKLYYLDNMKFEIGEIDF